MKKILFSVIALISLTVFAATPAWADTKIGIINMQDLLQKLPEMKQIGDDLKKQFGDQQKQFADAQDTFKKDAEKYQRNSTVMSNKDKQTAEDKLFNQQQNLQKVQLDLRRDYMAAQNKAVDDLMNKVKAVVEKVAEQDKLDLILINASVAYARKDMDVTAQVLQQMGVK